MRQAPARSQAGFTLVEMLVVITIIGLIMALVGPRVLNYLGESKARPRRSRSRASASALDLLLSRPRPLPDQPEGLAALWRARQHRRPGTGPICKGGVVPNDPWGHALCLSFARRARAYEIISYGSDGQEGGSGTAADIVSWHALRHARGEARLHADRDRVRARHHRHARGDHPAGDPARHLAREARSYAIETAALLKADRNAAMRRARAGRDRGRRAGALDPLRRYRPARPACRTMWRSMRCWRRAAISAQAGPRSILPVRHVVRRRDRADAARRRLRDPRQLADRRR